MNEIEKMNLEEVDAYMAQLRERRRTLKKSGKAAERKITTLANRRERLMERVRDVEDQIGKLRRDLALAPVVEPRRRGRRPKSSLTS